MHVKAHSPVHNAPQNDANCDPLNLLNLHIKGEAECLFYVVT